ncbi:unnamed protein product [Auanema sp. JU1783]|nr:unnamed protein product [Auanema sp. JU1783]
MMARRALKFLYCHGLGSSIHNRTGQALVTYFNGKDHYFERLVYTNPGDAKKVWRISEWKDDIKNRIKNDQWILIASSAGGHCALNAARELPENVKGLFLFSPGSNLNMSYCDRIAPGAAELLKAGKKLVHPASRNGYPALVDYDGFQSFIDTCVTTSSGEIGIECPVHIVHGKKDDTVPYQNSLSLAKRLRSKDVEITLVEDGTHFRKEEYFQAMNNRSIAPALLK